MVMIVGLIVLLPFHLFKDAIERLWSYLRSWYYLDTHFLNVYYEQQVEKYERKIKALQEYDIFFK